MLPQLKKPTSLSDPFNDFSKGELKEILSKENHQLKWDDYQNILGPYLPAGTYSESLYYFELAVDYFIDNPDSKLDLISSIVWFISEYNDKIKSGNLEVYFDSLVLKCLQSLTEKFKVVKSNYVNDSQVLNQAISDFLKFKTKADLLYTFIQNEIFSKQGITQSLWILEMYTYIIGHQYLEKIKDPSFSLYFTKNKLIESKNIIENHIIQKSDYDSYYDLLLSYVEIE